MPKTDHSIYTPMQFVESREVCAGWHALLETTANGQTDVVITRDGNPLTAMIPYEDFVALRKELIRLRAARRESYQTQLASEAALSREWDTPEEDAAWASL